MSKYLDHFFKKLYRFLMMMIEDVINDDDDVNDEDAMNDEDVMINGEKKKNTIDVKVKVNEIVQLS